MSTEVEQELEEVSLFDDGVTEEAPQPVADPIEEAPKFEMPEKFKGKSIEDVVESYLNVEKALGNKSNEVGELRKLTDQILLNQTAQPQHPVAEADIKPDVGFDDFIEDPNVAVDKVLSANPRMQKLEKQFTDNAQALGRKALLSAHEDADTVVASPEFQGWIQESPVRLHMLQEAHVSNDAAAASDLLSMYKTTRKVATENAEEERDAIAKGELKKATVEKGSVPAKSKKVYKRTELIQLKITDRARYESMQDEINKAYSEGRVK